MLEHLVSEPTLGKVLASERLKTPEQWIPLGTVGSLHPGTDVTDVNMHIADRTFVVSGG